MSPISHGTAPRSFAVTAILSLAALGAPAAMHAQTGYADRALLNRVALTSVAPTVRLSQLAVPLQVTPGAVNGERALLAQTAHDSDLDPAETRTPSATPAMPVDGARALLGRRSKGARS
ncbi:MAG: hypothetical protein ACREOC_11705 [Gemmatimonadales bacterium]